MSLRKIRTDFEWMEVITKCRASGLTDSEWTRNNDIPLSTFYNALGRLRKKACQIPERQAFPVVETHEIVPIDFNSSPIPEHKVATYQVAAPVPAVKINLRGISVEINSSASENIIRDTISALLSSC